MSKQHKPSKSNAKSTPASSRGFDPEKWPYYVPTAFAVIFLALVILFSDFIFSNRMLHLSDQIQAGVFFRTFLVEYVQQHGAIPQWNPHIFGGMPYVEAFHGDIFYPLSVLKFFLSTYRWQSWTLFLHIFLAGIFMYKAARQFKLSKTASLLSGACYMFAAYLISLVSPGHDGKIYVTTLFPLVMLFLDKGLRSESLKPAFFNFSWMGLVIGVAILSPHPQMSYFMLLAAAFYTVFRLIVMLKESRSVIALIRPASLAVYAVVIGLLLSAIQFYPGYSYTTNFSPRSDEKSGWEWATSWSLHEEEALSLLVPEFSGTNSQTRQTYYWGKNAFKDNSESVGVVSIFVALIGFFFYRRKESYFFGGLALFALIYALGETTPIFRIFYFLIPKVKALRAPSMIMFIFSFSIALLAGMGLQAIIDAKNKLREKFSDRFSSLLWGFPAVMLLLALCFGLFGKSMLSLWVSLFYSDAPRIMIQEGVSKLDLAYINLPAIQSGAWIAFLFTALAALFVWMYQSGKAGVWVLSLLILLPVVDGVRFNKRFVDTVDPVQIWSPNVVTEFFTNQKGKFRVMNFAGQVIGEDILPFFGIDVVVGYHGNQLKWYDALLGGVRKLNQVNPYFLNLAGAEYLLMLSQQTFPDGYFGEQPVSTVKDFGPVKILKNENALPRAFLVDRFRVFSGTDELIPEVLDGNDDLREIVYLEQQPRNEYVPDTASTDSVWIIDYQADSVLLGVDCSANKILVLTDNFYEAWHAQADGNPIPILRSHGSFRAVEIPAGTRQVLFEFKSEKYRLGKLVTALTSLYLLVIIGVYVYSGRRKSREERKL